MLNFIEDLLISKKWNYSYYSNYTNTNSNINSSDSNSVNIYLLSTTTTSISLMNSIVDAVIFVDSDFNPHRDI